MSERNSPVAYRIRRRSNNNAAAQSRIEIKRKLASEPSEDYNQRVPTAVTGSRVFESSFDKQDKEVESEAEKYL